VLTNLPFLPPLDLGKECKGEEDMYGMCYTRAKCKGLGLSVIGHCTKNKSLCCSEVSSCNSTMRSPVSYFTSPDYPANTCNTNIKVAAATCYLRVVFEEFQVPHYKDQGGGGNCSPASFFIINMSTGGEEEVVRTGLLCRDKKGLEIILPAKSGGVVTMGVTGKGSWRVKTKQEVCHGRDRSGGIECRGKKVDRQNIKRMLRRRKKQLFSERNKKRKKLKRPKRSVFSSMFNWVFGEQEITRPIRDTKVEVEVETLLEIARRKVKSVPSEFFQVVTGSDLALSQYSATNSTRSHTKREKGKVSYPRGDADKEKHIMKEKNSENHIMNEEDIKRRKRHYKKYFPWLGHVTGCGGVSCSAMLISPRHALVSGVCHDVCSTSYTVFSIYRVTVKSVTILCKDYTGCDLTILTLSYTLPNYLPVLCHSLHYIHTLLGVTIQDRNTTRQLLHLAMEDNVP